MNFRTVVEQNPGYRGAIAYAIQQMDVQTSLWFSMATPGSVSPFWSCKHTGHQPLAWLMSQIPPAMAEWIGWINLCWIFREAANSGSGWINGAYHLSPEDFADWKGQTCSLERDMLPRWVQQKRLLACPLILILLISASQRTTKTLPVSEEQNSKMKETSQLTQASILSLAGDWC